MKPGPNTPLDRRVEVLEQALDDLRETTGKALRSHKQALSHLQSEVGQERTERTRDLKEVKEMVEDLGVGGLHLERVGVAWLFVGVSFGTLPQVLAFLFG